MTEKATNAKRGCWKTGCLGCVALVILMVGIPLILMVIGLAMGRPEANPGSERLSTELPPLPAPLMSASGEDGSTTTGGTLDAGEAPLMPDSLQVASEAPAEGSIELDVEMCRFSIEPGPPGSEIRVEADFDTASFALEETYNPESDGTWTYRLRFRDKLGWLRRVTGNSNLSNERVRLIVPRGRPFELKGKMGAGESRIELGGLWLTSVDLDMGVGEHRISFSEPTPQPIDLLRIDGAVGDLQILQAGNASPEQIRVTNSVGGARVDLSGDWKRDAWVDVDCGVGECGLVVPSDVFIEVAEASLGIAGERRLRGLDRETMPEEGAPTLTLTLSLSVGELVIQTAEEEKGNNPIFPELRREREAEEPPAESEDIGTGQPDNGQPDTDQP